MENMIRVYFTGITNMGSCIQGAYVWVTEDYTMNQLVTAIKEAGYTHFCTNTMRRFAKVH